MHIRSTPQAQALKRELEHRGIIVEAEKWDGHKHIDLAIPRAHMDIEVDGKHHYEDADQIVSDLRRSHFSDNNGFDTIHIPNFLLDNPRDLHLVADALAGAARIRAQIRGHRFHYHHYDHSLHGRPKPAPRPNRPI